MISGTSKIWSTSGPIDLLTITKTLQLIKEKYGFSLGRYDCCQCVTLLKIFETCIKAPRNYSASFWSNRMSVLLYEGLKPPNSMIWGFLDPWEPSCIDLNIPK